MLSYVHISTSILFTKLLKHFTHDFTRKLWWHMQSFLENCSAEAYRTLPKNNIPIKVQVFFQFFFIYVFIRALPSKGRKWRLPLPTLKPTVLNSMHVLLSLAKIPKYINYIDNVTSIVDCYKWSKYFDAEINTEGDVTTIFHYRHWKTYLKKKQTHNLIMREWFHKRKTEFLTIYFVFLVGFWCHYPTLCGVFQSQL